jgi:hypothetical protein
MVMFMSKIQSEMSPVLPCTPPLTPTELTPPCIVIKMGDTVEEGENGGKKPK